MEMPEIEWPEWYPGEPSNKEFLQYKESCINDVLSRLQVYVDTLCTLQGFRSREDVREVVRFCLREFVAHFWDLPASRDFHHNGRWGLLCHSLDVAFRRAVDASRHIAIDKQGKPSAEAAWKNRTESVLVAWITGLFHDCGKIFDVKAIYKPFRFEPDRSEQGTRIYHPLMGGLLGFKLKHPEKYLVYEWRKNRGMRHVRLNPGMFVILMQQVAVRIMQSLDHEQIIGLFESLIADGDEADAQSVADFRKEEDENHIGKAVQLLASDGFKARDRNGYNQVRVFYLGHNTYVFIHPLVVQTLAKYIKDDLNNSSYDKDAVLNYLLSNGYIFCSEGESSSGKHFSKEILYINENEVSSHISFVNGDLFSDVDVSGVPAIKLKYSDEAFERIREIFGSEPPMTWFRGYESSTSDVQSTPGTHPAPTLQSRCRAESTSTSQSPQVSAGSSAADQDTQVESVGDTEQAESAGDAKSRPESPEESRADREPAVPGKDGKEAEQSPSSRALANLLSGLRNGELVVDDPENEYNIGFVSVMDGHFWMIHPTGVKKIFSGTDLGNVGQCLDDLSKNKILRMNGNRYITEGATMFHRRGMENTPQGKYAVLDRGVLVSEAPELDNYI